MTLDQVNSLDPTAFVEAFGDIAEDTPWVAAGAALSRPYDSRAAMVDAFQAAVSNASRADQEALIRAHPDLAGRAMLAPASRDEQAGAGLDSLSADELARFTTLNRHYRAKFRFPFILAVKGASKHQILDTFAARIDGGREEEFLTALAQVMRIIRFRLEDRIDG
ncbi:2-oxo-4-hydroxy-4-carboxy-5-ureidoimidazoline decarboxylase [Labrys monachus]|uniref:2-oxo-4-hydroxy-4-carboxy-5-ureidoimidazoline decarboxylase n=1 Tax=Labrys monachus TaxID=217067 RepID=A0ABU0FEZ8_9HYPH|nr:2-oxo-4-hydroxy-4-carboxy-5-ureidoimidazoline decarboxylase [Labrys monachus]MDQ0393189.1 2-oxo-4-hydroxy-4-carboxy-5-ureidoimidazoline decarboxylase [Labrys monachus]